MDDLPTEQREIFDLLYYNGLPQSEAARMLGMSERTLKQRWREIRLGLAEAVDGAVPGEAG